jgi:MFS family permease
MTKHRWLLAWGLGSVPVGAASLLVPLYVVSLGGDPFDLGLLGAVAAFVGAPGAIAWGRLADRTTNPRAVVLFSLVGVGLVLVGMPLTESVPLLIVGNAALWLAFAAAGPVLTLLVVAETPEREWGREIALLNTYQGYGWAAGLLLGIVWSASVGQFVSPLASQQSLFVATGLTSIAAAVLFGRWMPHPTERQIARIDPERVARLLSTGRRNVRGATFVFNPNRLYWSTRKLHPRHLAERFTRTLAVYFLAVVLFFTGFSVFFAPLPLFLTDVGFSSDLVFALYLLAGLGSAMFYTKAGTLSTSYDLRTLQTISVGVRGFAMPLVAIVGTAYGAALTGTLLAATLFGLIGLSWAVIAVSAGTIVTRIAPPAVRGEALGLFAALSALAGGIGSIAGGALANVYGFTVAFGIGGVVILLGAGLVTVLRGISTRTRVTLEESPSENAGS